MRVLYDGKCKSKSVRLRARGGKRVFFHFVRAWEILYNVSLSERYMTLYANIEKFSLLPHQAVGPSGGIGTWKFRKRLQFQATKLREKGFEVPSDFLSHV